MSVTSTSKPVTHPSYTVRASAGTGKTYYLVSKIVRCLLSGAEPGSILAITFTRKAAAEMQQRVVKRLRELTTCDDTALQQTLVELFPEGVDDNIKQRARGLYQQLLLHPYNLHISTFHAFCQEVLQRFAIEADIPPGSQPLEKTYALRELAWERLMQQARENTDSASGSTLAQQIDLLFTRFELSTVKKLLLGFIHNRTAWWAFTNNHNAIDKLTDFYDIDPEHQPLRAFGENEL